MNSGAGGILDKCKGFGLADNLQLSIQEFRTNLFLVIFFPLLFNTFTATSFEGNLGLCGFQVLKECYGDEAPSLPPSSFDEGDDSTLFGEGFGWKAVTMGYGCGFVFGVATGYIVFRTRKPSWFFRMVEDIWNLKSKKTKKNVGRCGAGRN